MAIKIPTTFAGRNCREDYLRMMSRKDKDDGVGEKSGANTTSAGLEIPGFIYVPTIKLYVAEQRKLLNSNWNTCQEELHKANEKMLTIPEFIEFLKYTKNQRPDIYNEITEVRDPWRAEWLDADFKYLDNNGNPTKTNGNLYVNYNIFENGKIVSKTEKLDDNTLMEDKAPGINLEELLSNSTKQGLPRESISEGKFYYWYPRSDNNSVAGFRAYSGRAGLDCDGVPTRSDANLGVRAVRRG